ncbi:MAG: GNAT family N-acetyltransferase [Gemmatimonadaceae bacterium]|nr:GNAT family N-acetyltransferase [Gemmatimonadaceae bacterium]
MRSARVTGSPAGAEASERRAILDGERLAGNGIYLRLVELADCGERYRTWLGDPEVNRFLETRWAEHDDWAIREFVSAMRMSLSDYLFAIVEAGGGRHVGNIKLGAINWRHLHADISYFIGEHDAWGRGVATEAIRVATRFAFERLGLHRVQAVVYADNSGSATALERAGYAREGVARLKVRIGDGWTDQLAYGMLRPESVSSDPA